MTEDTDAPAATFPQALDAAIRDRGTSVASLLRRLDGFGTPVSESALRSWRTGERRPEHGRSLDAVANLERILGLDPGSLTSRLGPSRRLRRSPEEPHDELVGLPGTLAPLLESIGCFDLEDVESVGGTLVVDIGTDRRVRATSNQMLWRARADGARRVRATLHLDDPTPRPPTVRVVGADLGRSAYDPRTGWAAWELLLPRPLRVGETTMIEWSCDDAAEDSEVTNYESVAERRIEHGGLWVRFDGDGPRHVERFEDSEGGWTSEVVPLTGSSVQHHVHHFGPGCPRSRLGPPGRAPRNGGPTPVAHPAARRGGTTLGRRAARTAPAVRAPGPLRARTAPRQGADVPSRSAGPGWCPRRSG